MSRMTHQFAKWFHWFETALLASIATLMIVVAAYQVVARNFFDSGLLWGDAFVRVLVLWVTMVGAMVASREDRHIRIDLVSKLVSSERARTVASRFAALFTAALCAAFGYYAFQFVRLEYEDQTIAFASVPTWICVSVMPVTMLIVALRYARRAVLGR